MYECAYVNINTDRLLSWNVEQNGQSAVLY